MLVKRPLARKNLIIMTQQSQRQSQKMIQKQNFLENMRQNSPRMPYKQRLKTFDLSSDKAFRTNKYNSQSCINISDNQFNQFKKLRSIEFYFNKNAKSQNYSVNSVSRKKYSNLVFTPKGAKKPRKPKRQPVKKNMNNIAQQLKNMIEEMKQIYQQFKNSIKQIIDQFVQSLSQLSKNLTKSQKNSQFQSDSSVNELSSSKLDTSFKIQCQAFKVDRIFKKYEYLQKMSKFGSQIYPFDFSILRNNSQKDQQSTIPLSIGVKRTSAQLCGRNSEIKTDRSLPSKELQFKASTNREKNFQIFKQTLNKMKKLSQLQDTIQKL